MLTAVYVNLRINHLTISKRLQIEDFLLTVSIVLDHYIPNIFVCLWIWYFHWYIETIHWWFWKNVLQ